MKVKTAFPFKDGEILTIKSGHWKGKELRVDKCSSFWQPEGQHYMGDPSEPELPSGWEIVLDIELRGKWVYFLRVNHGVLKYYL
jgi:hypothetical protein